MPMFNPSPVSGGAASLLSESNKNNGLVANGSGGYGTTYNFSNTIIDFDNYPSGSSASFRMHGSGYFECDDFLPMDPYALYEITATVKQYVKSTDPVFFAGIAQYDADKLAVRPQHALRYSASDTTLAAPLAPGDNQITLSSSSGWSVFGNQDDSVSIYGYFDSNGKTYDRSLTPYTRWTTGDAGASQFTHISGNVVHLARPFSLTNPAAGSGGVWPSGTQISQTRHTGVYNYLLASGVVLPTNRWERFSGFIGGVDVLGVGDVSMFRAGVEYVKIMCLKNYGGSAADVQAMSAVGAYRVPLPRSFVGL